jgi:DNA-directed RNA polymerase subunit RPC12/RpoP
VKVYHERDCAEAGITCGGVYQCATCGKLFGWCHGAHSDDDTEQENESCDECWCKLQERKAGDHD